LPFQFRSVARFGVSALTHHSLDLGVKPIVAEHLMRQDRIFYSASAVFGTMDFHILLENIYERGPFLFSGSDMA
jgi:hypothetical protein